MPTNTHYSHLFSFFCRFLFKWFHKRRSSNRSSWRFSTLSFYIRLVFIKRSSSFWLFKFFKSWLHRVVVRIALMLLLIEVLRLVHSLILIIRNELSITLVLNRLGVTSKVLSLIVPITLVRSGLNGWWMRSWIWRRIEHFTLIQSCRVVPLLILVFILIWISRREWVLLSNLVLRKIVRILITSIKHGIFIWNLGMNLRFRNERSR